MAFLRAFLQICIQRSKYQLLGYTAKDKGFKLAHFYTFYVIKKIEEVNCFGAKSPPQKDNGKVTKTKNRKLGVCKAIDRI